MAIGNTLEGVTAEQAAWKPEGTENSIRETLNHVTYYNHAYLLYFKGIDYEYDVADNDETFKGGDISDAEWKAEVAKFDATMTEWRDLIAASDESRFAQPVSYSNKASWAELIANVNAHNAYHGGQILLIRKLQGSWNPAKGVS